MAPAPWADEVAAIARDRDRDGFMRIYDHFWPRLVAYLLRLGVAESQAQEFSQEVLFKLWQRPELFDPNRATLSTWLFTVARNLHVDSLRRRHGCVEVQNADELINLMPAESGQASADLHDQERRLAAALDALPADQAQVIRLSYYEAKSQREIAQSLGWPLGTVKSKVRLAFAKLRDALSQAS